MEGLSGTSGAGASGPVRSEAAAASRATGNAEPGSAPGAGSADAPSPYTRADLYDLLFNDYDADLDFYLGIGKAAGGPVLDVGCGTGRVLLRALEAGLDVEGLDDSSEMLTRLRQNAAALGFTPRVTQADMRTFRLSRRFACVMIPFNAFAHMLAAEDQVAALRCCCDHLVPGGRLTFDVFSATPAMLAQPAAEPVLELETTHPATGRLLRLYDRRRLDPASQMQHSRIEIHQVDAGGATARVHRFETVVRWIYPSEMELLLRMAGFARWQITGGFDGRPAGDHQGAIVVSAWKDL